MQLSPPERMDGVDPEVCRELGLCGLLAEAMDASASGGARDSRGAAPSRCRKSGPGRLTRTILSR
jgi:hypothetical protein